MAQQATVLILADVDDVERSAIESACADAGFSAVPEASAEAAISKLTGRRFDAFVVHLGTPGAALACMRARGKLLRIRIPVVALVDSEDDAAFARAYRAGADEVLVSGRPAWLAARLRALPKPSIPQPGNLRGDAVVADADRTRAEVLERVLRDAGFRVEVAVDGFSTRLQAGRPALKVAIVDASLDDVGALITQARSKGARCAWVVRARPEQLDELRLQFQGVDRVSVVSAYGPPDDVLFETNRLLEQKASNARADARLLHGTILRLKWGGEGGEDIGYTYNVSSLGLYVRTLVAPAAETLVMDVTPPGSDARVRLEGKVAWRREFGTTRKEPVPAGFGVQIVGGDIDRWAEACPRVPSLRHAMPPLEASEARVPRVAAKVVERSTESASSLVTAPGDVDIRPREPQPSVEEMLASVLSETIPDEEETGSAPLSIDGDSVVELDAGDRMTELPDPGMLATQPPPVDPSESEPPSPDSADEPPAIHASEITTASLGFDLSEDVVSLPAVSIPIADVAAPLPERGSDDEPRRESTAHMVASKAQQPTPEESVGFADTMRPGPEHEPIPETRRVERAPAPKVPSWRPSEGDLKVPKTGVSPLIWGIAAFLVAGAVAAIVMPSHQHASTPPAVPVAAPATAGSASAEMMPAAPASAEMMPAAPASAEMMPAAPASAEMIPATSASAEVMPAASASAAVEEASPSAIAVPAPASPDAALASLKKGFAVLYVDAPVATNVYVYGLLAGTTNEPITTKCGPRFIRLGTRPGAWQGEGVVQIVKCGAVTHVAMSGQ